MARCWIGTSGFNYKHWKGTFYPADLPQAQWLRHYAQRFDTVELNVTFYRLPQPSSFRAWAQTTQPEFQFVIKGSRFVTHIKRLREAHLSIPRLMHASQPLKHKRACILWQLPPQMKLNAPRLQEFVDTLQADPQACRTRHAFEFRNPSWLQPQVFRTLQDANMALVHADMPFEAVPPTVASATIHVRREAPATADWLYLRRHGPNGVHTGYTDAQIERDREWVQSTLDNAQDVYVYYNNDVNTHAPNDAQRLRAALGLQPMLTWRQHHLHATREGVKEPS